MNDNDVVKEWNQFLLEVNNGKADQHEGYVGDRILPKRKTWADQVEEDEDDDINTFDDEECENESLRSVGSSSIPTNKSSPCTSVKSKLNSKAPIFVLRNSPGVAASLSDRPAHCSSSKVVQNSVQERTPLDALEGPIPHTLAHSAGPKVSARELQISGKSPNKKAQFRSIIIKPIGIVAKRHEPGGLVDKELENQHL